MDRRKIGNWCMMFCAGAAAVITVTFLFLIIGLILVKALPSLSLYFITTAESEAPGLGGGIANALVGSIIISVLAILLASPIAIGTAVYLTKYARESTFTRAFRFLIEVLSGTPSIILGVFGLIVLVYYLKPLTGGYSLIAGSIALGLLTLPVIERAAEHAIGAVNRELEEGSYALGANKWDTIRGIVLPVSIPGIFTGILLGFGRAIEESSVVILTAGYSQFMPELAIRARDGMVVGVKVYPFQTVVGTMPYAVYNYYQNSNLIRISDAFACALVLICVVLVINLAARGVIYLGMNSRGGSSFVSHLDRLLSMRRIDRVVEPVGSSRDDETNCPFQELEREEGKRLMAKGKERTQGKWGQGP